MKSGHLIYSDEKFKDMPIHKKCVNCWDLIKNTFTIVEDNNIDIDSIEEMKVPRNISDTRVLIINELVQAVKQLNREIKELKEKLEGCMSKNDLIKNLKAELYKIEKQNKVYGVGETRYDLMIKDVLNYINNSIPKQYIQEKIEESDKRIEKYKEYRELGKETDVEYYDFIADSAKKNILEEILEGK